MLNNIDFSGFLSQFIYWIWIIIISSFILAIFWIFIHIMSFPYKITYFKKYSNSYIGPYTNRVKWKDKNKTQLVLMKPYLMNHKIPPIDEKYIYHRNNIFCVVTTEGKYDPLEFDFNNKKIINNDKDLRVWQNLKYRENIIETQSDSFWESNKHIFVALGTVLFCCVLVGVTIYFTYQFATGGQAAMNNLADAIKNVGNIPSK